MKKVSVIIPAYNSERYISECISSLQAQSHSNLEILIFDDASTDSTPQILDELEKTDSRIKVIHSTKNRGPMYARMHCIEIADSHYTIFIDSDDTMPTDAITTLVQAAETTHSDIVVGSYNIHRADSAPELKEQSLPYSHCTKKEAFEALCQRKITHSLWAKIFRTELLQNHRYTTIKNFNNSEDAILFYEVLDNCTIISSIPETLYNYRVVEGSSSNRKITETISQNIIYARSICSRILKDNKIEKRLITQMLMPIITDIRKRGFSRHKLFVLLKFHELTYYTSALNILHSLPFRRAAAAIFILSPLFIPRKKR